METTAQSDDEPNYFAQLTHTERLLIARKLLHLTATEAITPTALPHAQAIFHSLIFVESQMVEERFLTLRNFVRQVGAMPVVWQQINAFIGVNRSYLELTVHDHHKFLAALKTEGYAVNSWMEKVSRWAGHGHRFDSARAQTDRRHEPQLHFVNDRADEAAYGPNYFFVHWDAQSVYARRGWLIGRIAAGRTHKHHTASPQCVDAFLDRCEEKARRREGAT